MGGGEPALDRGGLVGRDVVQHDVHAEVLGDRAVDSIVGSMGQIGSPGDNAAMESFFALLQKNVLDRRDHWAPRDDLRFEIVTWIERTYHQRRRQAALGRLTPIECETILSTQTATVADPTCHINGSQSLAPLLLPRALLLAAVRPRR